VSQHVALVSHKREYLFMLSPSVAVNLLDDNYGTCVSYPNLSWNNSGRSRAPRIDESRLEPRNENKFSLENGKKM
jgi:hypothetical protein